MNRFALQELVRCAPLAALVTLGMPEMIGIVWAQQRATDLAETANILRTRQASSVAQLLNALFYLGGFGLVGGGLLKLKAHADNPAQTPLRTGVGMLGAGGALVAAPYVANWANNTLGAEGPAATFQRLPDFQ